MTARFCSVFAAFQHNNEVARLERMMQMMNKKDTEENPERQ